MSKAAHLFNRLTAILIGLLLACPPVGFSQEAGNIKKSETSFYQEVFDQNFFYEGTGFLRLDRFYRAITGSKVRAKDVNRFGEVPDNAFFTNRRARKSLSQNELEKGPEETSGPAQGTLTVLQSEFLGTQPGFFRIRDTQGNDYELGFDPFNHPELVTSAEVIASRFFHAIGYNVPQFAIFTFEPGQLAVGENAILIDNSGFEKKLTEQRLMQNVLFLPTDAEGRLRASARKAMAGIEKGYFPFHGWRSDEADQIEHENRRDVRALRVFSSWLGNYRIGETNTKSFLIEENGRRSLKHYLVRFNYALGAAADEAKPPMFSYEYFVDFGDMMKAFFTLGLWEKPWQKSWREAGEKIHPSPAVGYFSSQNFEPGQFKTELPFYAFKNLTRADGFWAAKIIMSFSDDDISAMVKAGRLSNPEDAAYLTQMLIERRDLIGRYWFGMANPLDGFGLKNGVLLWNDLAVDYGFAEQSGTVYQIDVFTGTCACGKPAASFDRTEPSAGLGEWLAADSTTTLLIRTFRATSTKQNPYVLVEVNREGILGIQHED